MVHPTQFARKVMQFNLYIKGFCTARASYFAEKNEIVPTVRKNDEEAAP
jgi:hypothetical protein